MSEAWKPGGNRRRILIMRNNARGQRVYRQLTSIAPLRFDPSVKGGIMVESCPLGFIEYFILIKLPCLSSTRG
jgi:hypothetical protein